MKLDSLAMAEAKDRLLRIEEYMPGENGAVYVFWHFFAGYLQGGWSPSHYLVWIDQALCDCLDGKSVHREMTIPPELMGRFPGHQRLQAKVQEQKHWVAEAIFPPEFAAEILRLDGLHKYKRPGQTDKW